MRSQLQADPDPDADPEPHRPASEKAALTDAMSGDFGQRWVRLTLECSQKGIQCYSDGEFDDALLMFQKAVDLIDQSHDLPAESKQNMSRLERMVRMHMGNSCRCVLEFGSAPWSVECAGQSCFSMLLQSQSLPPHVSFLNRNLKQHETAISHYYASWRLADLVEDINGQQTSARCLGGCFKEMGMDDKAARCFAFAEDAGMLKSAAAQRERRPSPTLSQGAALAEVAKKKNHESKKTD